MISYIRNLEKKIKGVIACEQISSKGSLFASAGMRGPVIPAVVWEHTALAQGN